MCLKTDTVLLNYIHQFQYFMITCLCTAEIYQQMFQEIVLVLFILIFWPLSQTNSESLLIKRIKESLLIKRHQTQLNKTIKSSSQKKSFLLNFNLKISFFQNNHRRCSVKKGVLRNLPATLLKKRLWRRCFPHSFVKFLRTPFLQSTFGRLLLFFSEACLEPSGTSLMKIFYKNI